MWEKGQLGEHSREEQMCKSTEKKKLHCPRSTAEGHRGWEALGLGLHPKVKAVETHDHTSILGT